MIKKMVVGIIIKGTVGGYRNIYVSDDIPEASKRSIGYDVRSDSPPEVAVGEECYAISFSNTGKVCRKYRIMYDLRGDLRVGFLEISLLIPFNKRINGDDVKSILDALMSRFILENGHELRLSKGSIDSGIINEVINNHKSLFNYAEAGDFSISPGSKDAAYIYYHEGKLKNYFEDVNHNQYKDFKQVLLLAEKTRVVGKILNAISHSSEITDLDIENPDYVLNIKGMNEIKIRRLDNNQYLRNGDNVKMNTQIIIEISRLYNEPNISEKGTFEGFKNKLGSIVCIDPNLRSITINLPDFKPIETIIRLNISDGEVVSDSSIEKINFKSSTGQEKTIRNQSIITFKGEETEQEWYCEIKNWTQYKDCKGDRFTPAHVQNNTIPLILDKKKELKPKGNGNGESGIKDWIFYVFIITALVLIGVVSYLLIWEGGGDNGTDFGPLDKAYGKKIIDYSNGMELFSDSLYVYNDRLSAFQPDSTVNSALNKAINVRHAIEKGDSSAIENMLLAVTPSDRQKPLFAVLKGKNINYLKEIPDRKNISLTVIKQKLDSIIKYSKENNPIQQNTNLSDVNTGGDIEVEPINTGSGSEEGTPVNDNSHNEIYSNKVFQEIVVGFKSVPKFYELDDKRLSQEQKELLNIIKAHLSDFSSDKKGRFKISTPWPTFKDEILGLK